MQTWMRRIAGCAIGIAVLIGTGVGRADDAVFEVGGESVVKVPVEYHPKLGVFVKAYVNGQGPYQFQITLSGATSITRRVAKAAAVQTSSIDRTLASGNQLEVQDVIDHATLSLAGEPVSLKGAWVLPADDYHADVPIENYGGRLGLDRIRDKVVKTDFSNLQIVMTSRFDEPASGATELKQEVVDHIRMPIATVRFDGGKTSGDFALTLDDGGVWFMESSELGKAQFGANPKSTTIVCWTPHGLVHSLHASSPAPISLVDRQIDDILLARSVDPLQVPGRGFVLHAPLVDGALGLQGLKTFDIAVDNRHGVTRLTPRAQSAPRCAGHPVSEPTPGFMPWVFEGKEKIGSVVLGSAADKAGVRPGDDIVSIDGGTVQAYYEKLYENHLHCVDSQPVTLILQRGSARWQGTISPN
ncbi:hypothetical protein [Burkholderia plantarii]|uniref:hypothetical protein n=1 Tax=Burkholderia plantarii TaxID=41899 RepID=UPI0018DDB4EC|nr:hypothetical protein [Burkholderia plantarii]MBI0327652.1 hypothetical protein [Burkholderia plantarii]